MLFGMNCVVDCFVCVLFYIDVIFKIENVVEMLVSVFGVICNVLFLFGIMMFDQFNILLMCWCMVVDYKCKLYFFEFVLMLNMFWVDLNMLDFSEGVKVLKLDLGLNQINIFLGVVNDKFKEIELFKFFGL